MSIRLINSNPKQLIKSLSAYLQWAAVICQRLPAGSLLPSCEAHWLASCAARQAAGGLVLTRDFIALNVWFQSNRSLRTDWAASSVGFGTRLTWIISPVAPALVGSSRLGFCFIFSADQTSLPPLTFLSRCNWGRDSCFILQGTISVPNIWATMSKNGIMTEIHTRIRKDPFTANYELVGKELGRWDASPTFQKMYLLVVWSY